MAELWAPSSKSPKNSFWLSSSLPQMAAMSDRSPLKMV